MKNRLFITLDFPPENGGIQNYIYGLVTHLDPQKTVVLTSNRIGKEAFKPYDSKEKYKTYRININNRVPLYKQLFQLLILYVYIFRITKMYKIDELHFGNVMPIGLIGPLASKLLKVKFFPYIHGLDFLESKNSNIKHKLVNYCLRNATKIICNSNYTKSILIESGLEASSITIIHPGITKKDKVSKVDKEDVLKKYMLNDKFILITVGRLVKRKGHDKVIEALKEIISINGNIKYVICGEGPERKNLEELVKTYKLEGYVIFTGNTDSKELESLYSIAHLFIMPNREIKEAGDVEGYGIVFLEAGIHRLPVVGGNNGGVPDAVINGETGILIDSSDRQEIVSTIILFLKDKKILNQIGDNGYKWVNNNCLWSHRVKLLETLEG